MDDRVDVGGGRRMRVRVVGEGSPTVILDAGWGHWSAIWANVEPLLAERYRTFSFDRMGLGRSDRSEQPVRSPFQLADELDQAIERCGLTGPFVYVGASFGGVHARIFARRRPETRGMVFIDPVVETLGVSAPFRTRRDEIYRRTQRFLRLSRLGVLPLMAWLLRKPSFARRLPKPARREFQTGYRPSVLETVLAELSALDVSMKELAQVGPPRIPFVVLSAEEDWLFRKGGGETPVQQMHRRLAEHGGLGRARVVPGTHHEVHVDAPEAVRAAVDEVLAWAEERAGAG